LAGGDHRHVVDALDPRRRGRVGRGLTPTFRATATAPVRIADLGGWTDTWFAGHGLVCSIAVRPGVEVRLEAAPGEGRVVLDAVDFGDRYDLAEGRGRHPLLEACVDEAGVAPGHDVTLTVSSAVPPGAATGTSAAVAVAVVAALAALAGDGAGPAELAGRAWRAEAVRLGRQSGIQDQQAAAHGGVNRIVVHDFPTGIDVERLPVDPATVAALEARLALVLLPRPHVSSAVHETVIAGLEGATSAELAARLEPLRDAAAAGADALVAGDLDRYGRALVANHEAQAALHPSLVGADARAIVDAARAAGAVGWKVNGAGGDGGSLTLLAGSGPHAWARLAEAVRGAEVRRVSIDGTGVQVRVWGPAAGG
jgi:D-glycero-alpha-D-manno-heptose-7-phosphate kinase